MIRSYAARYAAEVVVATRHAAVSVALSERSGEVHGCLRFADRGGQGVEPTALTKEYGEGKLSGRPCADQCPPAQRAVVTIGWDQSDGDLIDRYRSERGPHPEWDSHDGMVGFGVDACAGQKGGVRHRDG